MLVDTDADGDLDIVFANYHVSNEVFRNLRRQVSAPWFARAGRGHALDFQVERGFARPGQFALPFLSLSETKPPIRVPPFGFFALGPVGLLVLPPLPIPAPAGKVSLGFTIPGLPALVGRTLFAQALVLHRLDPRSWRFTNSIADTIIR